MSQVCALCAGLIEKRCLLIGDKLFHVDCASCFTCGATVSNLDTCFTRNNHLYCRSDFCRLFCTADHLCTKNVCPVCQLSVRPGDVIQCVGERKYHFVCFRCSVCHQSILTGDSYRAEPNGLLVCFKTPTQEGEAETENAWCNSNDYQPRTPFPYKDLYKHSLIGIDPQHHHMAKEHFDQRKTKRVRTSFKHYQIQLMKQAFAEKPNPDSNDLKKLSNQTGLAKRVLQVWFQNARAKQRKICADVLSTSPETNPNNNAPVVNHAGNNTTNSTRSDNGSIESFDYSWTSERDKEDFIGNELDFSNNC